MAHRGRQGTPESPPPPARFTGRVEPVPDHPRFFYDLRSPDAWLAAERVVAVLREVPEFVPVDLAGLAAGDVGPFRCATEAEAYLEDAARRAAGYDVLTPRWPRTFPPEDTTFALLGATYAKQIGKVVAFSMACFRQAFNAGRDLADRETVFLAGAAAEIHPAALAKGAELRGTRERLERATAEAAQAGVLDVPAVVVDGRAFHGDAELERAAEALAAR
jgi:2-hydroxychromene-2-carboxylate isomerase